MEVGCLEERRATALGRTALCQRIALKRPEIHKYHTDMYMRSVLFMSMKHKNTPGCYSHQHCDVFGLPLD